MNETTVRLLWAAAGLLLVSGCIFASLTLWRYAACWAWGRWGALWVLGTSKTGKRSKQPLCEALIVKERKLFYHKRSEEPRNGCLPASFFGQPS